MLSSNRHTTWHREDLALADAERNRYHRRRVLSAIPLPITGTTDEVDRAFACVGSVRLSTQRAKTKTPIIDAFIACAIHGWGLRFVVLNDVEIRVAVEDFPHYMRCASILCAKKAATVDLSSRMKALSRWFPAFPHSMKLAHLGFEVVMIPYPPRHRLAGRFKALWETIVRVTKDLLAAANHVVAVEQGIYDGMSTSLEAEAGALDTML